MKKTVTNLAKAFIGESQARNRYTTYGKTAMKEGYEEIAANFFLTSDQEAEHAKWLMRMINEIKEGDDALEVEEAEVVTITGDTKANLKSAISGENYEYSSMYPEFSDTAEEEGYPEIAKRLRSIAEAEANHERRYKNFLKELEDGTLFKKDSEVKWQCRKCGYKHTGKEAPESCPSCGHPQAYFETICQC